MPKVARSKQTRIAEVTTETTAENGNAERKRSALLDVSNKRTTRSSSKNLANAPVIEEPVRKPRARAGTTRASAIAVDDDTSGGRSAATDQRRTRSSRRPGGNRGRSRDVASRKRSSEIDLTAQQDAKKSRRASRERNKKQASKAVVKDKQRASSRTRGKKSNAIVIHVPTRPVRRLRVQSSPCSDFLLHTKYELARKNFDATKYTLGMASHDSANTDDVNQVSNYVTDIFQRLYHAETITRPKMYMNSQNDINGRMRSILVDWLVEVHMKFRLVPETLYLCVNIIDRYCSRVPVQRSRLQLVGVTALLLACKYEEIYPPEVRDCVYITDRAYTRQEVLEMEQDIVNELEFKMTVPTAFPFLQRFLLITKAPEMARIASKYYLERTLQEHDVLYYRPSVVAAAAVALALNNPEIREQDSLSEERPGVPKELLEYTGFKVSEIVRCATVVATKVGEEVTTNSRRQLIAVKKKYDSRKYFHLSTEILEPDADDIVTGMKNRKAK